MSIYWWISAFAAIAALALILFGRYRTAAEASSLLDQAPEPRLLSTYNTAAEIEVIEEPDGSFHLCSSGGAVVTLNVTAATQIHRWFAPRGCSCNCTSLDGALADYETFTVMGGAYALRDEKKTVLVFDKSASMKLHIKLRPGSCRCGCSAVSVPGRR